MWIFIRQIHKETTRKELSRFVIKGLRPSWMLFTLSPSAKLKRCEIMRIVQPERKSVEYHGLVQINLNGAAHQMIDRLNGHELQSKAIEAHKYTRRSTYRDRRGLSTERKYQQERRKQERRREGLSRRVLHAPEIERTLGIH